MGFDCRVLQGLQGSLGRRFSSEHPTNPLQHVQGSEGDGPAAGGEWLGQEAKAPGSALPWVTSKLGAWPVSVYSSALSQQRACGDIPSCGLQEQGGAAWPRDLWDLQPSRDVPPDQRGKSPHHPIKGMPWPGSSCSVPSR